MVFPIIGGAAEVKNSLAAQTIVNGTAVNGTAVNIAGYEGNIIAVLTSAAASTDDTLDFAIEESATGTGSWTAVPADAIISPSTGSTATLEQVTAAAASFQVYSLVRERLKQYIRITADATGAADISIACAGLFVCPQKNV